MLKEKFVHRGIQQSLEFSIFSSSSTEQLPHHHCFFNGYTSAQFEGSSSLRPFYDTLSVFQSAASGSIRANFSST